MVKCFKKSIYAILTSLVEFAACKQARFVAVIVWEDLSFAACSFLWAWCAVEWNGIIARIIDTRAC